MNVEKVTLDHAGAVVQILQMFNPHLKIEQGDKKGTIKIVYNTPVFFWQYPGGWEYDTKYSLMMGGNDTNTFSYKVIRVRE